MTVTRELELKILGQSMQQQGTRTTYVIIFSAKLGLLK
jgi:hypothetical protein